MTVAEPLFRQVLSHLASGVVIVTARGEDGSPHGMTATAVCSVSLDPPLVMACMNRASSTHAAVADSRAFALNLLGTDAEKLARRFATPGVVSGDKFSGLAVRDLGTGSPVLPDVLGACDCVVTDELQAGDHTIFVGRVDVAEAARDPRAPLIYYRGRYQAGQR